MAKKSGSLFGRADASLVQAAFVEGKTKGPADYTGVYKTMSENYASMADDLMKEAKETYEALYKDEIALKEKFSPVYEELEKGNYTDQQRDQYYDIIEDYREQFNGLSKIKDKKERKKAEINLNSEFNALQKNLPLIETELVKIATFIANDQHVIGGMDGKFGNTNTENTNFLIGIADFHNKVDDSKFKTERIIEKGKVFYEVNVGTKKVKLDQNQISKLLPVQDHSVKKIWETAHTTGQTSGNTKGVSYDKFSGIFNTTIYEAVAKADSPANAFLTLSRYKGQFNKESFYDALNNPYSSLGEQIKTALENANLPDEFDVGGPKGVDESDFLNKENFTKIKKYIMSNPLFGAQVMADWATETSGKNAFDYGKSMLNASQQNKGPKDKDKFYAANMQLPGGVETNILNGYLQDLYSGTIKNPGDGLIYNINEDNSWSTEDGKNQISGNDMLNELYKEQLKLVGGWEFKEDGSAVQGKQISPFTRSDKFKVFAGSTKKKANVDDGFYKESLDLEEIEKNILSAATDTETGSVDSVIENINQILQEATGSIPEEKEENLKATKGRFKEKNTIMFNNKKYPLGGGSIALGFGDTYNLNTAATGELAETSGLVYNTANNKFEPGGRLIYEQNLATLIDDIQKFVEAQ